MIRLACLILAFVFVGCAPQKADTGTGHKAVAENKAKAVGQDLPAKVAAFPPDDWTHKEPAGYLQKKGLKVSVGQAALLDNKPERPAALLRPGEKSEPVVVAYLCKDARSAKETAGTLGEGAFATGRFAIGPFLGFTAPESKQYLKSIRDALESR